MSNPLPKTDVVIIGLGAAGGIAAYVLTKAGLNVVGLEAGPRLDKADFLAGYDELTGGSRANVLGEPKWNLEIPTWRVSDDAPTTQSYGASGMVNAVGGTSIHYSGQSWRFRSDDFSVRTTTVDRYGEKALPAGSALVDWPVTYDDLESYYDQVENLIGVSGEAGANPFESPRKNAFPMAPLRFDGYSELLSTIMTKLGYHPFPRPAAVLSEAFNGRPPCSYCGFCTGFGCWNDSKSSTLVSAIAAAEKTGKLDVRPNSRVMKILSDADGHATGVQYTDSDGVLQEQPAGVVILSSFVFENTRLLLLSTSNAAPHGLGNNSGQVGKYFIAHLFTIVNGYFPDEHINRGGGLVAQGVGMDDLDGDNFDHTGLNFIRGGLIFPLFGTDSQPIAMSSNLPPGTPGWGSDYKKFLKDGVRSVAGIMAQCEFLPYETNYLDLDPSTVDAVGVPVIRVTYDAHDNEKNQAAYMVEKLTEILEKAGASQTWAYPFFASPVNTHAYGGTRMGTDPAKSVVDANSLCHEVPNLAVLGGSTFCSTSAYNPTETIQALAWKSAEFIAQNFTIIAN